MSDIRRRIERRGFFQRAVAPAVPVASLFFMAIYVHNHLWRLGDPVVTRLGGHTPFIVFLLCAFIGAFYVYPMAYFRGAGPRGTGCGGAPDPGGLYRAGSGPGE